MSATSPWTGPRGNWFSDMTADEKRRRFGHAYAADSYVSDLWVEDRNAANYAALYLHHIRTGSKAPSVSKHHVTADEAKIIRDILQYAVAREPHSPYSPRPGQNRNKSGGRCADRAARRRGVR